MKSRNFAYLVVALLIAACARDVDPGDTPPEDELPPDTQTVGSVTSPDTVPADIAPAPPVPSVPGARTPMLTGVRTAIHDGAERIVFEFDGPLPGYKIEYIDRPVRQCGSGDVVEFPGDAWLSIRFFPANAHTEQGEPSLAARDLSISGRNLKRLKLICDFEAVVEWVAAVGTPMRYQTLELRAPDRLVIDVGKGE